MNATPTTRTYYHNLLIPKTSTSTTTTKLPRPRLTVYSAIIQVSFIILLSLTFQNARSRTSAMPRGFLDGGKLIACEPGRPVDLQKYFKDMFNSCVYCFCPEGGLIQCAQKPGCELSSRSASPSFTSNELPHRHSQAAAPVAPPPQPSRNREVAPPPSPARKTRPPGRTKTTITHSEPSSSSHVAFARLGQSSFDLIPGRKVGDDDLQTAAAELRIDRAKFSEKRNSYLRKINDRTSTTAATTTTTPEPTTTEFDINATDETLEPIEPEQALDDLSSPTAPISTTTTTTTSTTTQPPTFTNNDINLATGYVDLEAPETELVARLNEIQQVNNNGAQMELDGPANDTMFYVALGLELLVLTTILLLATCFSYRDFCQERKYEEQREEIKKQQHPRSFEPLPHVMVSNSNICLANSHIQ